MLVREDTSVLYWWEQTTNQPTLEPVIAKRLHLLSTESTSKTQLVEAG